MEFFLEILKSIAGIALPLIGFGVVLGVLFIMGMSGASIREGVNIHRGVARAKFEAEIKRNMVDLKKYHNYKRNAFWHIMIPVASWIVVYALLFIFIPWKIALGLLALVVLPILGYFGIFFVPEGMGD